MFIRKPKPESRDRRRQHAKTTVQTCFCFCFVFTSIVRTALACHPVRPGLALPALPAQPAMVALYEAVAEFSTWPGPSSACCTFLITESYDNKCKKTYGLLNGLEFARLPWLVLIAINSPGPWPGACWVLSIQGKPFV